MDEGTQGSGTPPQTIGERIKEVRERTGKSRPVVAGLVGKGPDWLKAIENNRLQPPRLDMLVRLAEALGVRNLAELTGETGFELGLPRRSGHPVVPDIREAIEEVVLAPSVPTVGPEELQQRVARAWMVWHTAPTPRASAGALLPQIIRDGRRAVRVATGNERRLAYTALAGAYALAEQVLAWVADSALLWLAADRCMECAQQADDPDTLALGAWVLGNVWRATGREDEAFMLAQDAVGLLAPRLDGSETSRAMWGACQLHASITASFMGREGDALRGLDEAMTMARAMGSDGPAHPWTLFGTANAELTAVTVQVELRKGAGALDAASAVDPDSIPSTDRRARLWLEMARAYALRQDWSGSLHVLQRATEVSQESMTYHPLSRSLAGQLVTSGGRLVERDARALASRLGLTV